MAIDYDNDGDEDLLTIGNCAFGAQMFRNERTVQIEFNFADVSALVLPANLSSVGLQFGSIAVLDFDLDGWKDLLLFGDDGVAVVYQGVLLRNVNGTRFDG